MQRRLVLSGFALAMVGIAVVAAGQSAPWTPPSAVPAATGAAEGKEIAALVAQLGDEAFSVREAASSKLQSMGKTIYPLLRKVKAVDPEVAVRIAAILDKVAPLWDGKESVQDYAKRADIEKVTKTLELGPKKVPLELRLVPAGEFVMGSGEVTLRRPFYLGLTHVTVDQFAAFADASGYTTDAEKKGSALVLTPRNGTFDTVSTLGASWRTPGFPQKGDHPAVQITWNDARAFCDWLSNASGREVRLPTEAQWEYACRAGTKSLYLWGDAADSGKDWANVADISLRNESGPDGARWDYFNWDDGFVYTAPGKSFKPNAFGLYDMIGNAWQWCDDTQRRYDGKPVEDPAGSNMGAMRVLRGASWNSRPFTCETTYRNQHPADYAYGVGGFRVEVVLNEMD